MLVITFQLVSVVICNSMRRVNEPNLVIRDGVIVTRPSRQSQTANQMDTVTPTPTVTPATNS